MISAPSNYPVMHRQIMHGRKYSPPQAGQFPPRSNIASATERRRHLRSSKYATAALALSALLSTLPAASYQAAPVDCEILLCLAGGFPPHPICTAAHAVMIARITPWPIEPPVQPWNCPMAARGLGHPAPLARIINVAKGEELGAVGAASALSWPAVVNSVSTSPRVPLWPADFADPTYDYVRAIAVWHVNYRRVYRRGERDECHISDGTQLGSYDAGLSFAWTRGSRQRVPIAVLPSLPSDCTTVNQRGIGLTYEDFQGRVTSSYFRY